MFRIIAIFSIFIASIAEAGVAPPAAGYVPNEVTAIKVAEAVLIPIYGESVLKERPFKTKLKAEVWYVEGSLPPGREGGVAVVEIRKATGEIVSVSHGK